MTSIPTRFVRCSCAVVYLVSLYDPRIDRARGVHVGPDQPDVTNSISGEVSGAALLAHSIDGGIHIYLNSNEAARQAVPVKSPMPPTSPTRLMDDVTRSAPRPPSPDSWDRASTDETPFTADALLPRLFTNDLGIEFARIAQDTRPSHEAGPSDLARDFTRRGCTEVVVGVYTEQPGPHATPENPVHVSVQVFAFPDVATARDVHGYLGDGGGSWRLTIWSAEGGLAPCPDGVRRSYRWRWSRRQYRYLATALAYRADLTNDSSIGPWLAGAAHRAATSAGPQNHHGI